MEDEELMKRMQSVTAGKVVNISQERNLRTQLAAITSSLQNVRTIFSSLVPNSMPNLTLPSLVLCVCPVHSCVTGNPRLKETYQGWRVKYPKQDSPKKS